MEEQPAVGAGDLRYVTAGYLCLHSVNDCQPLSRQFITKINNQRI